MASEPPKAVQVTARPPGADVRSSRLYLLSRGPIVSLARRTLSIASLAALDIVGLALGVYGALVLRSAVYGDTVFWNLLWETGPHEWLPFLVPITLLVFFQAGLYAARERRPGPGRVLASLVVVALIVLAFGLGTDYEFTTTGLIPTAVVTSALAIGLLRAAYDSVALELMKVVGIRRRVVLVGEGESLARLHRELAASRGGLAYELVGAVSGGSGPGLPLLGSSLADLPDVLERVRPDELILTESDFEERTVLDVVERAHRAGVKVRLAPNTTELLVHEGEYVPGQGVPLFELRPPSSPDGTGPSSGPSTSSSAPP